MAVTKYIYSVASDTLNGIVAASTLYQEIEDDATVVVDPDHIEVTGDVLDVWMADALTAGQETGLDAVVAAHTGYGRGAGARLKGLVLEPVDTPAAPTVAAQGTGGSTTWGYKVTAHSEVGETLASSETQITDGNATLDGTNYNQVSWSAVDGAIEYSVYRTTAGGTPSSTGLLFTTSLLSVNDKGSAASGTAPSEDRSGSLLIGDGIEASDVDRLLTIAENTSDVSTVTSLARLIRRSSGTVTDGFGTGLACSLEDAGNVLRILGALHMLWGDAGPTAADLEGKFRVMLRDGASSTLVEKMSVDSVGVHAPNLAMELVERQTVSGSAVDEVTFSSLDGDNDRIYKLFAMIKNADGANARTFYFRPNDVGGTDTDSARLSYTAAASTPSGSTYLRIGAMDAGEWLFAEATFYAKSGQDRMFNCMASRTSGTDGFGSVSGGMWSDTTSNVTSIVIKGSDTNVIDVGSEFSLYKIL